MIQMFVRECLVSLVLGALALRCWAHLSNEGKVSKPQNLTACSSIRKQSKWPRGQGGWDIEVPLISPIHRGDICGASRGLIPSPMLCFWCWLYGEISRKVPTRRMWEMELSTGWICLPRPDLSGDGWTAGQVPYLSWVNDVPQQVVIEIWFYSPERWPLNGFEKSAAARRIFGFLCCGKINTKGFFKTMLSFLSLCLASSLFKDSQNKSQVNATQVFKCL